MANDLFLATRKGLFKFERAGGRWQQTYVGFLGVPVTAVLADPRSGYWYAALSHGHFGAKLQRSTNRGATWEELPMPAFAKSDEEGAPSVNQVWAIEAGGPNILIRQGWMANTLKPGDKVDLQLAPMKDEMKTGGALQALRLPNGKTIGVWK